MCTTERIAMMELKLSGLEEVERGWLNLVRFHCMSYEHDRAEGWDAALGHAEASYGPDHGPAIAARVAVLVRAMRAERRGGFGYLSPHCPSCRLRISGDEWALIMLMRAGCRGVSQDIAEAAGEVARREEAPQLAVAAARFGRTFAAASGHARAIPQQGLRLH